MYCFVNITLYDNEVYYEYLDAQAKRTACQDNCDHPVFKVFLELFP